MEAGTKEKMLDLLRVWSNIFLRYINIFTLNYHKFNNHFLLFLKKFELCPSLKKFIQSVLHRLKVHIITFTAGYYVMLL